MTTHFSVLVKAGQLDCEPLFWTESLHAALTAFDVLARLSPADVVLYASTGMERHFVLRTGEGRWRVETPALAALQQEAA